MGIKKTLNLASKLFKYDGCYLSIETNQSLERMAYRDLKPKQLLQLHTLGELKAAGYQPKSIKQELRDNLIAVSYTHLDVYKRQALG